jgi:hypothetical protein
MHVIRGSLAVDKYALQKRYIVVLEAKVVRVELMTRRRIGSARVSGGPNWVALTLGIGQNSAP